ncbi:glycosyl hydrolase family 28-related protein [Mycetocola tolaasinivorans]|uniref:glycosyl hydrolase family 28-related protein n=1 Tax=Mycetocola tolaasinivorans TaxID=76635 RepID=UPI0011C3CEAB|nr:glycosyl hydrolase family 28-related protein [Mycetocola tolaasinivorans]
MRLVEIGRIKGPEGKKGDRGAKGDRGLDGVNGVENDTAVAGYVETLSSKTRAATDRLYRPRVAADIGAVGDGVADDTEALVALIDAAGDGEAVRIPAGKYKLTRALRIDSKSIQIDATGAFFTQFGNAGVFSFHGGLGPVQAASFIRTEVQNDRPYSYWRVASAGTFDPGGIAKLASDDIMPGGRIGVGERADRAGEFLKIISVDGNVLKVAGAPRGVYTQNIRIAALISRSFTLEGGSYGYNTLGDKQANPVGFTSCITPVVRNITIRNSPGPALSFTNCYAYDASNVVVESAENSPTLLQYGYGISDTVCEAGVVTNLTASNCRHAFTTGTVGTPPNSSMLNYGMTRNTRVSNSTARGTDSTAWDTHLVSDGVQFISCTAEGCYTGINFRGYNHKAIDCRVVDAWAAVTVMDEFANGGESYGHEVDGLTWAGIYSVPIRFSIRQEGHPMGAFIETRPSYFRNVRGQASLGSSTGVLYVPGATAVCENFSIDVVGEAPTDGALFQVAGGNLTLRDSIFDFRRMTAGTYAPVWGRGADAVDAKPTTVIADRLFVRNNAEVASRMSVVKRNGFGSITLSDVIFDYAPTSNYSGSLGGDTANNPTRLGYIAREGQRRNSAVSVYTTATNPGSALEISNDPVVTVIYNLAAPFTVSPPREPNRLGQRLVILNVGSSTVTIPAVGTISGTAKTLGSSQEAALVWTGSSWRIVA